MGKKHLNTSLSSKLEKYIRSPISIAIALAFSGTSQAATFTVTNTANSGAGSLRQAVLNANAASGADEINFNIASGSTITLSGSELLITDSLTISGPITGDPGSVVINGNGNSRVINATIPANKFLTLNNLTLTNGRVNGRGGGLKVAGASSASTTLTLNDTVITGNSTTASGSYHEGGGLYASNANITINNSTISNNKTEAIKSPGGGVFVNEVIITLDNSTLSGNYTSGSQSSGGGFYADGETTLRNSTVSGNWTSGSNSSGGGLYIFLDEPQNQSARINQSTISGNSTTGSAAHGGGLAVFKGDAIINQSTITSNTSSGAGGGLFVLVQNHSVFLNNSILAGNSGFLGNLYGATPTTGKVNASHSIFGDSSTEITGSRVSTIINNNPNLGSLQDNGGPTLTHLPNTTSIALNAGNNANAIDFSDDQRGIGFFRIQSNTVDIGSVERQETPTKPVLVSPLGSSVNPPAFKWRKLSGTSSYRLRANEVVGSTSTAKIDLSYTPSQAGCSSNDICEVTPNIPFAIASGNWTVTATKTGQNFVSDQGNFSIVLPGGFPPPPSNNTPTPTVTDPETDLPDSSTQDNSQQTDSEIETSGGGTLPVSLLLLWPVLYLVRWLRVVIRDK